jgi:hypothetical protein
MDLMNIVKIRSIKFGAHWTNRSIDQIIEFQIFLIDNVSGHMVYVSGRKSETSMQSYSRNVSESKKMKCVLCCIAF